jgi:CubicO group peptidase (beta-lactamase class C family)
VSSVIPRLVSALILCAVHGGEAQPRVDVSSIERALESELAETKTPGAALAVILGDEVLLSRGYGTADVETGEAVTAEHLFRLGSTTKLMTAAAVAIAAHEGKLDLTRGASSYVQGVAEPFANVSAHQLLSHTAGIRDQPADYGLHDEPALAEFVRGWKSDYRLAAPGRVFSYSNPGYALAGLLLQEAARQPYADAMKEILLAPLGMANSTFRPTEAMTHPFSQGHKVEENGDRVVVRPFSDDSRQWPNGFLMSSARDLSRFVVAFLNSGAIEGKEVIPPAVIARLMTPVAEIPYDLPDMKHPRYGYGLFLHEWRGLAIAEHAGTMPGFTSVLKMAPSERFGIVLLANQEGIRFQKTMDAAFAAFVDSGAKPGSEIAEEAATPMSVPEMELLAGTYRNRWPVTLVAGNGGLQLKQGDALWPVSRHTKELFSARAPGGARVVPFRILTGPGGKGELVQMFLWAFRRDEPTP